MIRKDTLDLERLRKMTEAAGVSGDERTITRLMKEALTGYADSFDYDNLGSLICYRKGTGKGPRVMLSSHTDEVGFYVKKIDERGILRVISLNHWSTNTLINQEVWVHTDDGKKIPGVFGTHFAGEDRSNPTYHDLSELYVDLGIRDRQRVLDLGVRPGNIVSMRVDFREMADPDVLMGKAWDDRVGVNIITDVMKELKNETHDADVFVCGTVQEEVGYRGGKTASHKVAPDISITVDVAFCDDFPGCDPDGLRLQGGVAIRHYDSKVLGNKALSRFIEKAATDLGYPVEIIVQNYGGGEAHEIHRQFDGVITLCLSIPSLYILTPRALIHKDRYVATVNTLVEMIKRLTMEDLQSFKESLR